MKATPLPPAPRFEEHFDLSTSVGAQNLVPPLLSTSVLCLASGVEGLGPPGLSSKPKDLSSKPEDLRFFLARALCAQVPLKGGRDPSEPQKKNRTAQNQWFC